MATKHHTIGGTPTFSGNVTNSGRIICDDTTDSSSGTTGSIQTDGGIGAAKDIVTAGNLRSIRTSIGAKMKVESDTDFAVSTWAKTGVLAWQAGIDMDDSNKFKLAKGETGTFTNTIFEIEQVNLTVSFKSTQDSTSTTTGAINTTGGLGVVKSAYFGADINAAALPSGATAGAAGAGAGDLWVTSGHATLPDNVVMRG